MALETLPVEILDQIFGYVELDNISLVNKRIRSIALKNIFSKISIDYPGDKFQQISSFLKRTNSSHLVRRLVIDAVLLGTDLAELVSFVNSLSGLRALECEERPADPILSGRKASSRLDLSIRHFLIRSCRPGQEAIKSNFLRTNYITFLECVVNVRGLRHRNIIFLSYDSDDDEEAMDGQADYELSLEQAQCRYMIKALDFIASRCPHLQELALHTAYDYRYLDLPPPTSNARMNLEALDLSCLNGLQGPFFAFLGNCVDLANLQNLSLPLLPNISVIWLRKNARRFKQLSALQIELWDVFDHHRNIILIELILHMPPLNFLKILGYYTDTFPHEILERHSTLQHFNLHLPTSYRQLENRDEPGCDWTVIDFTLLQSLTSLGIDLCAKAYDVSELFRLLRQLRLSKLVLKLLFPSSWAKPEDDLDMPKLFKHVAIDEDLARWIYDFCRLEYLAIAFIPASYYRPRSEEKTTKETILEELQGSYVVRKIGGRVKVTEQVLARKQSVAESFTMSPVIMAIFHSIWPSKGGDWRDDWHSLPIECKVPS